MKRKETNETIIESYDYLGKSASRTDCTGLIPSALQSDYELESYESIYPFRPPHIAGETESDAVSGRAEPNAKSAAIHSVHSDLRKSI
ncbi:MAG: hypothetical protein ACLU9Q_14575 [Marvinbryantia sp.]|uniref:hypothetical protein n=1 Tax=Marvinbryantia sp. TaxID=2496532 RepID=UPI0025D8E28A|nr:hypothetical protein [uncultured Marvinbryantia sp.]